MLRGVATPILAPGVLIYCEIWSQTSKPYEDVRRALAWELHHDEWKQPLGVRLDLTEDGFVVYVDDVLIFTRLLSYSDVLFIGDACYVLTKKGPNPP